ncbi:hypothetical protein AGMMS49545_14100 [Betaproteobacteria bacterium]|nr:hypothetical protein AGMMS49545_14100 [Betaproteobacteria bacterium]GHU45704.1 hypothetical protein AGMMS50289_17450 [Betaproteobacteria bacterium]
MAGGRWQVAGGRWQVAGIRKGESVGFALCFGSDGVLAIVRRRIPTVVLLRAARIATVANW